MLADGTQLSDEAVLSEGPLTGENSDRSFILTAPEVEHAIGVEYDTDETYEIIYNEDTVLVNAALNSNISGSEGNEVSVTLDRTDSAGTPFTETVITREFETKPYIIMNVDESYVGAHVSEIDLSNPNATLDFHFTRMEATAHLFYDEQDTVEGDSFITTRTLYIVEAPLGANWVSEDAMENIIADGTDPENGVRLIAQVHLGHSELINNSDGGTSGPFTQTIVNMINEAPIITTNFYWASDNSEEAFEEDGTGPNVWIGNEAAEQGNTGLVLEQGVRYTGSDD